MSNLLSIKVICYQCGQELVIKETKGGGTAKYGFDADILIQPCECCLQDAENQVIGEFESCDSFGEVSKVLRQYGRNLKD